MKKLDRLRWIQETFGYSATARYIPAYTWQQMYEALLSFWAGGVEKVGIRTDTRNGAEQGFNLPFVHGLRPNDLDKASALWTQYGDKLVYIVTGQTVQPCLANGVAIRLDEEHVFFEVNDVEPDITQRHMYDRPENLKQFVVGSGGHVLWQGRFYRCYRSEDVWALNYDAVYRAIYYGGVDEITFSIRQRDRSLVIW